MQIFRPMKQVIWAAEGKTGFGSLLEEVTRRAVTMLSGHLSMLKTILVQMCRPVQLVVLAAEGKSGLDSLIKEVTLTGGL